MTSLTPDQVETVQRILETQVPGTRVLAFGSRVMGTPKPYSDLDLAVVGKERLGLSIVGRLREAFESSDLPFRVDVVDWHALSEGFRKIVLSGHEVLIAGECRLEGEAEA